MTSHEEQALKAVHAAMRKPFANHATAKLIEEMVGDIIQGAVAEEGHRPKMPDYPNQAMINADFQRNKRIRLFTAALRAAPRESLSFYAEATGIGDGAIRGTLQSAMARYPNRIKSARDGLRRVYWLEGE